MFLSLLATIEETPIGPDAQNDSLLNLDPFTVQMILGGLIPFVVAFFTNTNTAPWFKKFLTVASGAVVGLLTVNATDDGGAVLSVSSLKAAVLTIVVAMTTYFVTLRNSKLEDKLQAVGPDIGPKVSPGTPIAPEAVVPSNGG